MCFSVICNDERQFVPLEGTTFSSLSVVKSKHTVKIDPDPVNKDIYFVTAEPRLGIGQRAILFVASDGIWMWDCIAVINDQAVEDLKAIEANTGKKLQGIVISHPHFYTTSLSWAQALDTYVYISHQDLQWYQVGGLIFFEYFYLVIGNMSSDVKTA